MRKAAVGIPRVLAFYGLSALILVLLRSAPPFVPSRSTRISVPNISRAAILGVGSPSLKAR